MKASLQSYLRISPTELAELFGTEILGDRHAFSDRQGHLVRIWVWQEDVAPETASGIIHVLLLANGRNEIFEGGLGDDVRRYVAIDLKTRKYTITAECESQTISYRAEFATK